MVQSGADIKRGVQGHQRWGRWGEQRRDDRDYDEGKEGFPLLADLKLSNFFFFFLFFLSSRHVIAESWSRGYTAALYRNGKTRR